MKALLLKRIPMLVLLSIGTSALAVPTPVDHARAIKAFSTSPQVREAREALPPSAYTAFQPQAVLLASDCGFVGCTYTYIVSQVFVHQADGPSEHILARVTLPRRGIGARVELVELRVIQ